MGIDLYEVDMVSLHPMRWLTDAIIAVATRYQCSMIINKKKNVLISNWKPYMYTYMYIIVIPQKVEFLCF